MEYVNTNALINLKRMCCVKCKENLYYIYGCLGLWLFMSFLEHAVCAAGR